MDTGTATKFLITIKCNGAQCIKFLMNGDLACGTKFGDIYIWFPQSKQQIAKFKAHSSVKLLDQFADDGFLVSASQGTTIKIWGLRKGQGIMQDNFEMDLEVIQLKLLRKNILFAITKSNNIKNSDSNELKYLNIKTRKLETLVSGKFGAIEILSDDEILAIGYINSDISILNWRTRQLISTLNGHKRSIRSLQLLNDGNLASGDYDGEIKIWNVKSNKQVDSLKAYNGSVNNMAILSNGCLVSATCENDYIKVWRV